MMLFHRNAMLDENCLFLKPSIAQLAGLNAPPFLFCAAGAP